MSNNLIIAWLHTKQRLDDAKSAEMALRESLVATYGDDAKDSGTENYPANGGTLKIVKKLDHKLVDPNMAEGQRDNGEKARAVNAALMRLVNEFPDGAFIAERLVKWSPELSVSEYKKLPPAMKAIIDTVLVTKPATPSLSFEYDKKKG